MWILGVFLLSLFRRDVSRFKLECWGCFPVDDDASNYSALNFFLLLKRHVRPYLTFISVKNWISKAKIIILKAVFKAVSGCFINSILWKIVPSLHLESLTNQEGGRHLLESSLREINFSSEILNSENKEILNLCLELQSSNVSTRGLYSGFLKLKLFCVN